MKKFFSFFAAMLIAVAANAAVINITNETANALQTALNGATTGDEIVMAAGTYEESGNYLAFTGKELTVRAAEGAEVVIKTVCPVRLKEGAKAEFINIKFDCSTIGSYEQVIVAADDTDNKRVILTGCEFYGWEKNKAMIQATSSRRLAAVTINNCYFHNCMKSVVFIENTNAIDLSITNSTFANISTDASSFWAGVIDSRATTGSILVDHCTFYNVQPMNTDYGAIGKVATPGAVVSNCIFMMPEAVDGVRAIRDVSAATNCITFNYLKDSGTGIHSSVTKNNCTQVDPKFVDAANGNYTLGDGSPALTMNDGQPIGDPRWVPSVAPEVKYYLKNNWDAASDWTWKEMTKEGDDDYQLVGVVFGGTGVNVNTAESDEGADWYPIADIATYDASLEPTTLKAKDTVVFMYTPSEKLLAAIVTGPYVEPSGVEHTYTVAGSSEAAFGTAWDPTNTDNDMVKVLDGTTYNWTKSDIALAKGEISFKVCENHSWDKAWPAQDYKLAIESDGIYTISISFDPAAGTVDALATKTGEAVVIPTIAMHGNFKGSWADTENFEIAEGDETASLKLTLVAGNYEFGMRIGGSGNWTANGVSFTRANASAEVVSGSGNLKLEADKDGDYVFTWTYATNTLSISFPVASGIDNTNVAVKAQKVIINGQLFIIRDGQTFNAQGQLQ